MELKDLIMKYYDSNDKTEKSELRSELLKKKTELDLPEAFQIAVLGHYEAYRISGAKPYLEVMLKYAS
ncbi:MAG: hypothetical protein RI980_432 [Bacteroidota bacterium]|jgi:hypothetical protein